MKAKQIRKWSETMGMEYFVCSKCRYAVEYNFKYCANCGAKLEKEV